MKKLIPFFIFVCWFNLSAKADHITGGEMYYTHSTSSGGSYVYYFTLKLYMRCNSGRMFNNPTIISVFDNSDGKRINDIEVSLSRQDNITLFNPDPCISNPPQVCYDVGYYDFTLSLPPTAKGYTVVGQVNYRITGIANLAGYGQIGATYTSIIPGLSAGGDNPLNNSARFVGSDLVIVCANNPFSYSFSAIDADEDDLQYSFCDAYISSSGPSGFGNNATPALPPPYQSVPYGSNFSGSNPLGSAVTIDSKTGLVSGIAPAAGLYVLTVCVQEIRKGKVIATQRKDLQIAITSCTLTAAILEPEYLLCRDTKTILLANLSLSTLINAYSWELKNAAGKVIYTASSPTVSYTFADTGIYTIKLTINPGQRCTDSTSAVAKVYPGFVPAFTFRGICFTKSTSFNDATSSVYGIVNLWNWDFGEASLYNDTSFAKNAAYTYPAIGIHNAKLVVGDTKGCRDSITTSIPIFEKPLVELTFRDTLICPPDTLQLKATGHGTYAWSPELLFANANAPAQTVSPVTTTTYYVDLDDDGCKNRDSVLVRVTDKVQLQVMNDTTICGGDNIQLRIQTNGTYYAWTPASQLNDATAFAPIATTSKKTDYLVTAYISKCMATNQITVNAVPYPLVNAGNDTVLCFNGTATLHGTTNAATYNWTSDASLSSSSILDPFTTPAGNTFYLLTAIDNKGCPKPATDSVFVSVLPEINPEATGDTAVITGEPLLLQATGGTRYFWYPSTGLSAVDIASPTAVYYEPQEAIHYTVRIYNDAGCADSAFLTVKVFSTAPTVFVPTGFTPNGDGKNDILRPVAAGITKIERFIIFNRYGQQVFSTTTNGTGWDGKINGILQQSSSYVWMVQAIDYAGKKYSAKGTSMLIR